MDKLKNYVQQITDNKIILSDNQLWQFERYYELLAEKNKVMNLTAITDRNEVILKHFIDSVAVAGCFDLTDSGKRYKVIDVGTGAGFPGIPLKIVFPHIRLVLFDSLNKRIGFLNEVIDELGIDKETCVTMHGRAEDGGRDIKLRESFDIALSRAVANMAVLAEYCIPFVKKGGYFIPYKTDKVDEELRQADRAIAVLGGKTEKTVRLTLPDSDINRSFIFINKIKNTPKAYPRKAGTANKQPIM